MNISQFFERWSIVENPFRGEEARHDAVFARMSGPGEADGGGEGSGERSSNVHSDFEKILGELVSPSTSVVFGEKGSGKTAIRLQIAERVARHNREFPERKTFLIPYDDLNVFLDQMHERSGNTDPGETFRDMRLHDHVDAVLSIGTARIVNALVPGAEEPAPANLGPDAAKSARRMSPSLRRDLLLLQAVYDQADFAGGRTTALRRLLRLPVPRDALLWNALVALGWIPAVALAVWGEFFSGLGAGTMLGVVRSAALILLLGYLVVLAKRLLVDRFVLGRLASKLWRELRVLPRTEKGYAASLARLEPLQRSPALLPVTGSDEQRYAMLGRLRRVLEHFGFVGTLVLIDRVDEPTLVNGDADRMRSIVWPMFNNKFLQQDGLGLKMLLPIELRYALFKESSAFFQEARLDKQNLVERLTWTGPMLYDLCNARLQACRADGAEPIALLDLFAEDVTRQDLVDALDQMHQPRDAFKFIYRCLNEHCSNVTADQNEWKVPRLVLDSVRKQEADRVQQLYRGIRPA